jgi:hypothetical protein
MRCKSCEYQLTNSLICPSCGHDNRDMKTEQVIYTPERVGSDNAGHTAKYVSADGVVLRKWLGFLFWLIIPTIIGALLSQAGSSLASVGSVITELTSLAYGLILLRLSKVESSYQKAGVLCLVSLGLGFLALVVFDGIPGFILIGIPAAIISMLALYYEFDAHSYVLVGVNDVLSKKWNQLWKWTIRLLIGAIVGILLIFISPLLAGLALIIMGIGLIIASIVRFVYLYQTARSF